MSLFYPDGVFGCIDFVNNFCVLFDLLKRGSYSWFCVEGENFWRGSANGSVHQPLRCWADSLSERKV